MKIAEYWSGNDTEKSDINYCIYFRDDSSAVF